MKAKEMRDLTDEELKQRYADTEQELFDLRIQKSTGQLEQPLRIRGVRKDIARIRTMMVERKMG
jgi:large subunit ribosomal protein L29